jgi:hypothetical protein
MLHLRITIISKYKQTTVYSDSVVRSSEHEYLFKLRESVLVPQFSKLIIDIPDLSYYYTTEGKDSSFFIDHIKYYSDVKLVDFPSSASKVADFENQAQRL